MSKWIPHGVIPACLMPFTSDLQVDESAYQSHLQDLASVDGVEAITINGHAAEVHALSIEEQIRSMEIAVAAVGDQVPLVAGIHTSHSLQGAKLAKRAQSLGIKSLLVFPPDALSLGGQLRPESSIAHFDAIASECDLPLILFQYPLGSQLGYPINTLLNLCERFPTIRAIKDWCNDPALHERHIRELHALDQPVNVLSTHSMWLMSSLIMGCDGLLSGAGSVIAHLQVALWRAVQDKDLARAQELNERIYPCVRAFYKDPILDMHNRMKESLVYLGKLKEAHVRPPLVKLPDTEIQRVTAWLDQAGLTGENLYQPVS